MYVFVCFLYEIIKNASRLLNQEAFNLDFYFTRKVYAIAPVPPFVELLAC